LVLIDVRVEGNTYGDIFTTTSDIPL
jgi:hypothetical protein